MRKSYETLIAFGIFMIFMIGVVLFSYMTYHVEKEMFYKQIDERLAAVARTAVILLGPGFHDRAIRPYAITDAEDKHNILILSKLANATNVTYVYTMIEENGSVYFTSSSATDKELSTGENLTHFFDLYDEASPAIKNVFSKHTPTYDNTPDKWGTFRSIIIPMKSPNGNFYAVGADIPIDSINRMLNEQLVKHFLFAFGLFFFSFITLLWRLHHINKLAYFDSLTGLPNRTELTHRSDYILGTAKRKVSTFAVMFMDLDHFKEINDTLGHNVGDELLALVAKRLRSDLRKMDTISRMGGDEFILLLPDTDAEGASRVAQKLLDRLTGPYYIKQHELTITASIGIALYPIDGEDIETLSKNADAAMYSAKQEGRNAYRFFTDHLHRSIQRHMELHSALHHALERNEFQLHYQPQISLHSGKLVGCEVLLRWNHPEMGSIPPAEFIPVAEEGSLILPIGEWVLRNAVSQVKQWRDNGFDPITVAINISAVQFRHADFPLQVTQILEEYGVLPEQIELELTETAAMHDPHAAITIMNELHARGVRISIDDFGTGYSSLSYLKKFHLYKLKIDRSFINEITTDTEDKAIVKAIIRMAGSLGMLVIAEGVETADQLEYLREQGCDEIQGYYYSKPLDLKTFERFMREYDTTEQCTLNGYPNRT